jgi:GT2 family glycosyltransferase
MPRNRKHGVSPVVDVVITTTGRFDMLRDCLAALDKQEIPHSTIIIDIASPAEERIANQEMFADRTTKRLQQNVGFPSGANEGARMGSAPLILFLGDDVTLFDGALEKMVRRMDDQTIGVCGAKLIFPLSSTSQIRPAGKVQHIGLALNIRGDIIHPLVGWNPDHPKTSIPREVLATTGACFMIRRSLFSKLGGFDLSFGIGTFEDVDLCFKARQAGFRIFVETEAKAYHYVGASAEKKQVAFPLQHNSMIFKSRWGGSPYMVWDEHTYG